MIVKDVILLMFKFKYFKLTKLPNCGGSDVKLLHDKSNSSKLIKSQNCGGNDFNLLVKQ